MTTGGLEALVEARIERAIARGELNDLPGQGSPLALDEETCVAPELRLAFRILKKRGIRARGKSSCGGKSRVSGR